MDLSKEQLAAIYNLNPDDYTDIKELIAFIDWFEDETAFKKANDKLSFIYESRTNKPRY